MTAYMIATMIFSTQPETAFEDGGCLHGFKAASLRESDEEPERYRALVAAAGYEYDADDELDGLPEDEILMVHHDGRMAIVGPSVEGHPFVLEVELTPAALAHHRRQEIKDHVDAIGALEKEDGAHVDVESLAEALDELEEIEIEIVAELRSAGIDVGRLGSDPVSEIVAMSGSSLCLEELPIWLDDELLNSMPVSGIYSASAGGRYVLWPPDGSCSGDLTNGLKGWTVQDLCAGETYYAEDDGCVLLDSENHGGPSLLAPTDEGMVDVGIVLDWIEDHNNGAGWYLLDQDIGTQQRLDRAADWNPALWGWAS